MVWRLAPAVAATAATILLGLPTLIMPLHPDQASFAMVGKAVASGRFPYVDVWDLKAPGLYFLYALAIHGPFELARNVRVFSLGWTAVSAALIVELGRRWWNWRAGLIAALLYGLVWSTDTPFWLSAQPDSLAVLPIVLALLLYELARGRRGLLTAAGFALGFAADLRFTAALLVPAVPAVEAGTAARSRLRLWLGRLLWLGAGVAGLLALQAAYLLVGHALGEFAAAMRWGAGYTRLGGPWDPPGGPTLPGYLTVLRQDFWTWAAARLVLALPALAAAAAGAFVLRDVRLAQLLAFVLLAYVGIAAQMKFFPYHYGYLVVFLALLAGWGWDRAITALSRSPGRLPALAAGLGVAAVLLLCSPVVWDNGVANWRAALDYARHPAHRDGDLLPTPGYIAEQQVAGYIRARTRSDASMEVWGFDPMLYLLAGRAPANRFLFPYPMMSAWAPRRWQDELVADLRTRRPAYIVVLREYPEYWIVGHEIGDVEFIDRYPALQQLLQQEYEPETEIADRILYHRRAAAP
jgi:hypothetical protein